MKKFIVLCALTAAITFSAESTTQAADAVSLNKATSHNGTTVVRRRRANNGFFGRLMEMERRKNAWLRSAFGF